MTEDANSRGLAPLLTTLTTEGFRSLLERIEASRDERDRERVVQSGHLPTEEFIKRVEYVRMVVSLWSHVCMVDGELALQEELSVGEMMNQFFGSSDDALFPYHAADPDVVFSEMVDTFNQPYPLEEVLRYASSIEGLGTIFFEEACCIVASDSRLHHKETDFLNQLGRDLKLPDALQAEIKRKYIAHLAN
jgi:hypothetical protein